MKQVLVHEEKGMINHVIRLHDETKKILNEIYEEYKTLGLAPLDTNSLKSLYHNTDAFVRKQAEELVGEIPSFGGFKMKWEAFFDQLELPNYSGVTAKIRALNEYWRINQGNAFILDNFKVEEGAVILDEARFKVALDGLRIFANDEREIEIYKAMKAALDAYVFLDRIIKENIGGCSGLSNWRPEYYLKKDGEGKMQINPELYQIIVRHG